MPQGATAPFPVTPCYMRAFACKHVAEEGKVDTGATASPTAVTPYEAGDHMLNPTRRLLDGAARVRLTKAANGVATVTLCRPEKVCPPPHRPPSFLFLEPNDFRNHSHQPLALAPTHGKEWHLPQLNALDMDMFRALRDTAKDLAADPCVTAVVLHGSGRAFCAGTTQRVSKDVTYICAIAALLIFRIPNVDPMDPTTGLDIRAVALNPISALSNFKELLDKPDGKPSNLAQVTACLQLRVCPGSMGGSVCSLEPAAIIQWSQPYSADSGSGLGVVRSQDVSYLWRRVPAPVIVALHGVCLGGGLQIALGADIRVASPSCKLSVMEAKWGLIPDMGGSVALRELVPKDVALELALTGRIFKADEACKLGLVTRLAEDPLGEALRLASEIATRSPDVGAATKRLMIA
eukprot:gene3746-4154_t